MSGLVLYAEDIKNALEIKERLENQKGYDFVIKRINALDTIPENTAYVAAEWDVRLEFYKLIQNNDAHLGIAFYNKAFFSDIDDTEDIDIALDEAIRQKNWEVCKGINLFYLMGDIIRKRNALRSKPVKLQIETTDLCNAKCIMCSHAYSEGTGIDILESGIIDRIESILPFVKAIVLHGNGEPFLKKNITDYLRKMSQYGIKFIANTNLSIITDELLKFFNNSFIELNVSCDGHTSELYERIRKGLSFERFVKNVKYVRRQCPNLIMKMSVVVMKQNLKYMPEIVSFAREVGFNEVVFNQLCVDEINGNLQDAAYLYPDKLQKYTSQALEKGRYSNIKVTVAYALNSAKRSQEKIQIHNWDIPCVGVCDWLLEGPYIDLRGNIAVCCIKQKELLGNLYDDNFESIWNGDQYKSVRNEFRTGRLPSSCYGCDFLNQGRLQYLSLKDTGLRTLEKQKRC